MNNYPELQKAIQYLAGRCNWATTLDSAGFNKYDAQFGHVLADLPNWTPKQTRSAWKMLAKYRKQLARAGIDYSAIPEPPEEQFAQPHPSAFKFFLTFGKHNGKSLGELANVSKTRGYVKWLAKESYTKKVRLAAQATLAGEPTTEQTAVENHSNKITAEIKGAHIIVSMPYHCTNFHAAKHAVKDVPGRRWDNKNKVWKTPLSGAARLLRLMKGFDNFVPSTELVKFVKAQEGKRNELANVSTAKTADFQVDGLGGELMPFQRAGVAYAAQTKSCMIADEMGLGKTIEALAVIKHLDAFPAIVVCPAAVKINWAREAKKWLPGKTVEVWYGRNGNGNNRKADIIIINYDIISDPKKRDKQVLRDDLKAVNSKTVILDESHYIKSHKSRRTRAAKELGKGAMIKLCLTGTPVLNRPNELISPLTFLERLEEIGGFWHFVNRYCLPPNAPILMADLTEKVISEIQIGDKVIGWDRRKPRYYHGRKDLSNRRLCESEVLQILVRKAPLQKIILEDNTELVCTPDHRWLNGRSEQREPDKEYSVARTGRLGGRERGCASRIVQILEAPQPQFGETTEYKQGYLIGLFRGDGWCTRTWSEKDIPFRNNKSRYIKGHSVGVTTKDRECIDRSENYIQDLAPNLIYRRHQRKDKLHSLGMNHAEGFKFITSILPIDLDAWWAGFLGGIYDAEGSGLVIGQYRKYNPQTWKMIIHALERFGFEYRIGKQERTIRVRGGRSSMLKLWKIANPTLRRKLVAYCLNTAGRFSSGNLSTMRGAPFVTAIKQLPGIHKVYTLTTTTGNYVAYGCGSKNCDAHHNGWGWDFSGASNLDELHSKLKETCFIRRRKEDVLLELPTKRRAVVPIPIDNNDEYQYAERNLVEWVGQAAIEKEEFLAEIADLNEEEQKPAKRVRASEARWKARNAEQLVRIEALKQLAVKGKMASLKKWVKDFLETGEKLVVFAHHRAVVKELAKEFKAPTIMGGDNLKTRQEVIDEFQTGSCQLIVCSTKAVGVGITLTAASNVAFVELGWTPAEMLQAEDRLHRIGQPNAVNVHLLLAAGTVEEEIARLLDKKRSVIDATTDGTEMGEDEGILKALIKALQKE